MQSKRPNGAVERWAGWKRGGGAQPQDSTSGGGNDRFGGTRERSAEAKVVGDLSTRARGHGRRNLLSQHTTEGERQRVRAANGGSDTGGLVYPCTPAHLGCPSASGVHVQYALITHGRFVPDGPMNGCIGGDGTTWRIRQFDLGRSRGRDLLDVFIFGSHHWLRTLVLLYYIRRCLLTLTSCHNPLFYLL